jgi:hypothetical protein
MTDGVEFRLEDYWRPGDVRPGGPLTPLEGSDLWAIEGNPDLDFAPAFHRIMAELVARYRPGPLVPARILFTGRATYHFYATLVANHPVVLHGVGVPNRSGSSRLRFHDCTGIHVCRSPSGPTSTSVGMAVLDGLGLDYAGAATTGAMHHGILIHRTSELRHLSIHGFPGHGLHVEGDAHEPALDFANVSMTHAYDSTIFGCGRTGVWVKGRDANVCLFSGLNSFANGAANVPGDGFGIYDESVLGNTWFNCHTRNNRVAGYRAAKFLGLAPNRSTFINCYSEHSPEPVPEAFQEGPALLDNNALVITSFGEGGLADCRGGATVITTTQGRLRIREVASFGGANNVMFLAGDSTVRTAGGDPNASRQAFLVESRADGNEAKDISRYYFVHDTKPSVRAWGFKHGSPETNPLTLGFTDGKHLRPGLPVAPRGMLLGTSPNRGTTDPSGPEGPRRIGFLDPRSEKTLRQQFPNALPGDLVWNSLPNHGAFNFLGWILAYEEADLKGATRWYRYGEGALGTVVPELNRITLVPRRPPPPLPQGLFQPRDEPARVRTPLPGLLIECEGETSGRQSLGPVGGHEKPIRRHAGRPLTPKAGCLLPSRLPVVQARKDAHGGSTVHHEERSRGG